MFDFIYKYKAKIINKKLRDMQDLIKELEEQQGKPISEFNKLDWTYISLTKKLSEEFVQEYQDKLDYTCISRYLRLSERYLKSSLVLSEGFIKS